MYFEIINKDKRIFSDDELRDVTEVYSIMSVPYFEIEIPIKYNNDLTPLSKVIIHGNKNYRIYGLLLKKNINLVTGKLTAAYAHTSFFAVKSFAPMNYTVKQQSLAALLIDENLTNKALVYTQTNAKSTTLDYTFSKQNKIEVLDDICKQNIDLFWRVPRNKENEINLFSPSETPIKTISKAPSTDVNIHILSYEGYEEDYSEIVNIATAYAQKGDGGNTTMTLDPRGKLDDGYILQDGFPIVTINKDVTNNDRNYTYYVHFRSANNQNVEWAVIDEESHKNIGNIFFEGNYPFNDLYPVPEQPEKRQSGEKRKKGQEKKILEKKDFQKAWEKLYESTVRKMKQTRLKREDVITCENDKDINPGDCIRLIVDEVFSFIIENGSLPCETIDFHVSFDEIRYVQDLQYFGNTDSMQLTLTTTLATFKEMDVD